MRIKKKGVVFVASVAFTKCDLHLQPLKGKEDKNWRNEILSGAPAPIHLLGPNQRAERTSRWKVRTTVISNAVGNYHYRFLPLRAFFKHVERRLLCNSGNWRAGHFKWKKKRPQNITLRLLFFYDQLMLYDFLHWLGSHFFFKRFRRAVSFEWTIKLYMEPISSYCFKSVNCFSCLFLLLCN